MRLNRGVIEVWCHSDKGDRERDAEADGFQDSIFWIITIIINIPWR